MTKKTCKHLRVPLRSDGKRVVYKNASYHCDYPVPDVPPDLPRSITRAYGFRWPPHKTQVWAALCRDCPCFEEYKKADQP